MDLLQRVENTFHGMERHLISNGKNVPCATVRKEGHNDIVFGYEIIYHYRFLCKR